MMSCYVAAPFAHAAEVRSIHGYLIGVGITPTSSWATTARGAEDFSKFSPEQLRRFAEQNDADLRGSDVVLIHDPFGEGRETYAEAARAILWGKPVVWRSKVCLSQWRPGVVRVHDLDEAIGALVRMQMHFASGMRGQLLATVAKEAA